MKRVVGFIVLITVLLSACSNKVGSDTHGSNAGNSISGTGNSEVSGKYYKEISGGYGSAFGENNEPETSDSNTVKESPIFTQIIYNLVNREHEVFIRNHKRLLTIPCP